MGARKIVLPKKRATTRNVNQVLDRIPISHQAYEQNKLRIIFPDGRYGCHQGLFVEYAADGTFIIRGKYGIQSGARRKAQQASSNSKEQHSTVVETQEDDDGGDEKN